MAIVEGAFVKTLFPTNERPRQRGPLHICYCLGLTPNMALVAYTTSRPWPAGTRAPPGVRIFNDKEAASLNQRAFVLFLNRLAKLPLSARWFPDIDTARQGVIAVAPAALRDQLLGVVTDLMRRRQELVQLLGP